MPADALDWLRQLLGGGQDAPVGASEAGMRAPLAGSGIGALFDAISGSPTIQAMRAPNAGAIDLSAATGLPPAMESILGAERAYDPTRSFAANALDPRAIEQAMNIAMSTGPGAIRAYHGSPALFAPEPGAPLGRFRWDKIGTGEGAQAYGYAPAYLAEHEPVARGYRDTLAQKPPGVSDAMHDTAKYWWDTAGGDPQAAVRAYREFAGEGADPAFAAYLAKPPGHMYEVQINAEPEQFLDWDKPLSEQPETVRRAYTAAAINPKSDPVLQELFGNSPAPNEYLGLFDKSKGSQAYATLADRLGSISGFGRHTGGDTEAASAALREAGIPGIRYLDQGSRGTGAGTHNYAVWMPELVTIMRRYGILPPLAAGAAGAGLLGSGAEPPT